PVVASPRRHGRTQLGELVSLDPGLGPRADFQRRKRYPYFYLSLVFPCVGPPGRPHVATVGFASKFWSERTPGEAQGGSGIGSFGSPQIWGCRGPKPPCSDQGKATDPGGPASPSLGLLPRGRPGAVDRRLHGMRSWSPTGRPPATGHASFSRQPRGWRPRAARPAIGRCRGGHLRWDSGERPYRWSICVLKTPDGGYGTGWLLRFRGRCAVMTAAHVLPSRGAAGAARVAFGCERGSAARRECQFDARLFVTNQRLDYTIVGSRRHCDHRWSRQRVASCGFDVEGQGGGRTLLILRREHAGRIIGFARPRPAGGGRLRGRGPAPGPQRRGGGQLRAAPRPSAGGRGAEAAF
ncbi:unnamed protein product, partial [Prorocentrum cordatum]